MYNYECICMYRDINDGRVNEIIIDLVYIAKIWYIYMTSV